MKKIAILGSTGSIGAQALDVVKRHPDEFRVTALTAHHQLGALLKQCSEFRPSMAALTGLPDSAAAGADLPAGCRFLTGPQALASVAEDCDADMVLVSVSGMVGLCAVIAALKSGKQVLLANKESLVAGGEIVTGLCRAICEKKPSVRPLLPVDSEHSAVFQCLEGSSGNTPVSLILTASGGPFRTWSREKIARATLEDALGHPTWNMGRKITIDSATMFNKGLEIIEARWLFDMPEDRIEVVIHPQSIIHSMVRYADGSVMAQMGMPDMRVPILYAMTYPRRMETGVRALELASVGQMTFEAPDEERFPALRLAREALLAGGTMCCALNAANECAAHAFLDRRIGFSDIYTVVHEVMQHIENADAREIETVLEIDAKARKMAEKEIFSLMKGS